MVNDFGGYNPLELPLEHIAGNPDSQGDREGGLDWEVEVVLIYSHPNHLV
jgi:hypothetical protein